VVEGVETAATGESSAGHNNHHHMLKQMLSAFYTIHCIMCSDSTSSLRTQLLTQLAGQYMCECRRTVIAWTESTHCSSIVSLPLFCVIRGKLNALLPEQDFGPNLNFLGIKTRTSQTCSCIQTVNGQWSLPPLITRFTVVHAFCVLLQGQGYHHCIC